VQATSAPADAPLLVFDTPIAIVGGGTVDAGLLRELDAAGVILIGADGGADTIDAACLVPAAIIGDLDSLVDRASWEGRTRVIHLTDQVTTDFEKAMRSTRAPVTLALGMTGGRLDHTLAALSAVLHFAGRRPILLVDAVDVALAQAGNVSLSLKAGERVSVHPLVPTGFRSSTGLLYPLDTLTLAPGGRIGTSNAALGGPVGIVSADDVTPWLLILERSHLWMLIDQLMANKNGR
jgi:thiamine pyrophosphokinase